MKLSVLGKVFDTDNIIYISTVWHVTNSKYKHVGWQFIILLVKESTTKELTFEFRCENDSPTPSELQDAKTKVVKLKSLIKKKWNDGVAITDYSFDTEEPNENVD